MTHILNRNSFKKRLKNNLLEFKYNMMKINRKYMNYSHMIKTQDSKKRRLFFNNPQCPVKATYSTA